MPWSTSEIRLFVIVMDVTGVVLIFLALPVLLFPLFEETIETTAPSTVENGLSDHVVICQSSPRVRRSWRNWRPGTWTASSSNRIGANSLDEDGCRVIHADPQSVGGLEQVYLSSVKALPGNQRRRRMLAALLFPGS